SNFASSLAQAEELNKLAVENGAKTIIGIQTRKTAQVHFVKRLLDSGKTGTVQSADASIAAGIMQQSILPAKYAYVDHRNTGGSIVSILCAHTLDALEIVHGDLRDDFSSRLAILQNAISVLSEDGSVEEGRPMDTSDHVLVHGAFPAGGF